MKACCLLILFLWAIPISAQEISIATYNIRLDTPGDNNTAWSNRHEMVTGLLRFHAIDVFGLQEALSGQIEDIHKALPQMKYIGVGRDDGKLAGEFSPIFFDSTKFEVLSSGWFWLSETPDKPGKGWDAHYNRICTWAKLKQINGLPFLYLNTHLDNQGTIARIESARLIVKTIEKLNPDNLPVILSGDFNSTPQSEPYAYISQWLTDSKLASNAPPYGPDGTFNAFDFNSQLTDRIDYIFVNQKVDVLKYGVLSDSKNNRYPSDHLPVMIRFTLK